MVSGPIHKATPDSSAREQLLRAFGDQNSCTAQKSKKPAGLLWGRSHLQRAGRLGHSTLAFDSHYSSDSGSSSAINPQASGPVSKGAGLAFSHCPPTERPTPIRFHCGALPVFSSSGRSSEPEGSGYWYGLWNRGTRPPSSACPGLSFCKCTTT
jgi:hypothetical protein